MVTQDIRPPVQNDHGPQGTNLEPMNIEPLKPFK